MNRGQAATNHWPTIVGFVLIAAIALVMLSATSSFGSMEYRHQQDMHQAYCNQAYGSPELISANVVGEHGGWHCAANPGGPHLHQIPDSQIEAAWRAEMGFPHEELKAPTEVAEPVGFLGFGFEPVGIALVLTVIAAVGIALFRNFRRVTADASG